MGEKKGRISQDDQQTLRNGALLLCFLSLKLKLSRMLCDVARYLSAQLRRTAAGVLEGLFLLYGLIKHEVGGRFMGSRWGFRGGMGLMCPALE